MPWVGQPWAHQRSLRACCLHMHRVALRVGVVGHPLVSSPRVPGGLEDSRRDSSPSLRRHCMRGTTAGRWQSRAMTKPVSRYAKLKGPKESTGRALVNCASGKYRSSPIKLTSLDMSLEHWCRAKVMPLQVLQ